MVCRELRGLLAAHHVSAGSQGMEKNVVGRARVGPPQSGSLGVALAARRAALPRAGARGGWLLPALALAGKRGSQLRSASLSPPERVAAAGQAAGHDAWPAAWGLWHPGGSFGAATQRLELCCCAPRARGVRLLPALALAGSWVSRRLACSQPPKA